MKECARLSVLGLGIALGITWALGIVIVGLTAWLFDWGTGFVNAIGSFYIGYKGTFLGTVYGLVWSICDGFITGVILAWIYNGVARCCNKMCSTKPKE